MKDKSLKVLVQTALFVALALVVRMFSLLVPIGGVGSMRIGFSEIFTKMPAFLFGPVMGGAASGMVDFLAQVIKSEGAYLWPMLIVMILGGALTGFLWRVFRRIPADRLRIGFIVFCILLCGFGVYNHITLNTAEGSMWHTILSRLKENILFATYGMYGAAVLGLIFVSLDTYIARRREDACGGDFLQITLTILISDIVVTTLNTFVLRYFYSGLAKLPFAVVYIPRLIPDFVQAALFAYIISCLLKIYNKIIDNI